MNKIQIQNFVQSPQIMICRYKTLQRREEHHLITCFVLFCLHVYIYEHTILKTTFFNKPLCAGFLTRLNDPPTVIFKHINF